MNNEPNWQPISMLPIVSESVDGMLSATEDQLVNLRAAQAKPHVMDDHTLNRVAKVYNEQLEHIELFEKQLYRWQKENLTADQATEVSRLLKQSIQLKAATQAVLEMAQSMGHKTIDKIMAMDEFELLEGIASGRIKPPM